MACEATVIQPSVYPSGALRAVSATPMLLPAPGLWSMMNCWPKWRPSQSHSRRPWKSVLPPGENGMMRRTGLLGQDAAGSCAPAVRAMPNPETNPAPASSKVLRFMAPPRAYLVSGSASGLSLQRVTVPLEVLTVKHLLSGSAGSLVLAALCWLAGAGGALAGVSAGGGGGLDLTIGVTIARPVTSPASVSPIRWHSRPE